MLTMGAMPFNINISLMLNDNGMHSAEKWLENETIQNIFPIIKQNIVPQIIHTGKH